MVCVEGWVGASGRGGPVRPLLRASDAAPGGHGRVCFNVERAGLATVAGLGAYAGGPGGMSVTGMVQDALERGRKAANAPEFSNFFTGDAERNHDGLLASHTKGMEAMKAVRPDMPVGFNLAMQDDQPAPEDTRRDEPGCADRQANPPARLHTPAMSPHPRREQPCVSENRSYPLADRP